MSCYRVDDIRMILSAFVGVLAFLSGWPPFTHAAHFFCLSPQRPLSALSLSLSLPLLRLSLSLSVSLSLALSFPLNPKP